MRIVPALDVAEEHQSCVRVRREAMLRETLAFEGREEAFGHRVDAPICQESDIARYAAAESGTSG